MIYLPTWSYRRRCFFLIKSLGHSNRRRFSNEGFIRVRTYNISIMRINNEGYYSRYYSLSSFSINIVLLLLLLRYQKLSSILLPGPTLSLVDFSFTLPLILNAGPSLPIGALILPYAPGPGLSLVSFSLYLPLNV